MCRVLIQMIFIGCIGAATVTAQGDESVFPPDPVRSLEEKKMKPMVAKKTVVATSGSANKTADMMANRAGKVAVNPKGTDANRSAIEKSKKQALQKAKK